MYPLHCLGVNGKNAAGFSDSKSPQHPALVLGCEVRGHRRAEGSMASEAPVPSPTRATGRVQKLALGASQTLVCSSRLSPAVLGGGGGGRSCGLQALPWGASRGSAQSSPHQCIQLCPFRVGVLAAVCRHHPGPVPTCTLCLVTLGPRSLAPAALGLALSCLTLVGSCVYMIEFLSQTPIPREAGLILPIFKLPALRKALVLKIQMWPQLFPVTPGG